MHCNDVHFFDVSDLETNFEFDDGIANSNSHSVIRNG